MTARFRGWQCTGYLLSCGLLLAVTALHAEDAKKEKSIVRRSIPLEAKYLLIPIKNGAPSVAVDFESSISFSFLPS